MKTLFTAILLLASPLLAWAEGEITENREQSLEEWLLVGETRLEVLFFDVYDAKLHTKDGDYQQDELPAKLEIQYLRDIKAKDLIKRTQKEWKQLGVSEEQSKQWAPLLEAIWSDVAEQDMLTLEVNELGHSQFFKNQEFIGALNDPEFSQSFLDIWVSPDSSFPKNQKELTGSKEAKKN